MTATLVDRLDLGLDDLEIRLDLDELMTQLEPGWRNWSAAQTRELSYAVR